MSYRSTRILARLCLLAILFSVIFCCTSCSTKQKATNRYKNTTEFEAEQTSSEKIQNAISKDCTAVSKTETDWKSINENIQFELIDPNQEGYANLSPDGKGGFNFSGKNVKAFSGTSQEEKKETRNDTVTKKESDNSSQELDTSSSASGQTLDSGRTSDSKITGRSFWFYVISGFILLFFIIDNFTDFSFKSIFKKLWSLFLNKKE